MKKFDGACRNCGNGPYIKRTTNGRGWAAWCEKCLNEGKMCVVNGHTKRTTMDFWARFEGARAIDGLLDLSDV